MCNNIWKINHNSNINWFYWINQVDSYKKPFSDIFETKIWAHRERVWHVGFKSEIKGMLEHSFSRPVILFLCSTLLLLPCIKCPACKPEVHGISIRAFNTRREQSIAALRLQFLTQYKCVSYVTDKQTDRQILWHQIQGYVGFFFRLNLLPPTRLARRGIIH